MRLRLAGLAIAAAAGIGLLAVTPATATVFNLTSDHCSSGCLQGGSAGTITVVEQNGGLQYTVDLNPGFGIINTGGSGGLGASIGFGLDTSPISVSGITSGFSLISSTAGSIHIDGFGNFSYGLDCDICGTGATNPFFGDVSFFVSGVTLADMTQSTSGDPNAFFALDIYSTLTGNTGPVDASVGGGTNVPEPASLAIFGAALAGLGLVRRRRKTA